MLPYLFAGVALIGVGALLVIVLTEWPHVRVQEPAEEDKSEV